jgi:fatty acid desaturase
MESRSMEQASNGSASSTGTNQQNSPAKARLLGKWIDFYVAVTVWGIVGVVMLKLVPICADIFDQFGGKLPEPTRLLFGFSEFSGSTAVPLVLAGLVAFQVWRVRELPLSSAEDAHRPGDSMVVRAIILLGLWVLLFAAVSLYLPTFVIGDWVSG